MKEGIYQFMLSYSLVCSLVGFRTFFSIMSVFGGSAGVSIGLKVFCSSIDPSLR